MRFVPPSPIPSVSCAGLCREDRSPCWTENSSRRAGPATRNDSRWSSTGVSLPPSHDGDQYAVLAFDAEHDRPAADIAVFDVSLLILGTVDDRIECLATKRALNLG